MPERTNGTVLKTVEGQPSAGSNPALSARNVHRRVTGDKQSLRLFDVRDANTPKGFGVRSHALSRASMAEAD